MDTIAIKYFMEIAAGSTFWEVSEQNNISQSSVSKSILRLENELGVDLFNRKHRAVYLTPAGNYFNESLKKLAPEFNHVLEGLKQYAVKKIISCGITPSWDILDLGMRLQSSQMPSEITLNMLRHIDPEQLTMDLREGKLDFIITHRSSSIEKYGEITQLCHDPLMAVLPKNHRLAGNSFVTFSDLMNETILTKSVHISRIIDDICNQLNLAHPPRIITFDASDIRRNQIISMVSFGQGITVYFESDITPYKLDNLHVYPIRGCPEFPLVIASRKGQELSPQQEIFRKFLYNLINTEQS
ncbi:MULTISPECIES: LysR family transcriptional regulator [Hungatella]|uniref:LysR family transcriptional regulator n=1 Tax=Hungatella hathewayi TaxID=154046 RepID=A0AAW9WQM7_9FIRM|nr:MULTISPECIES: LysR family transcriptional regulator [Hungatella]MCQ4833072.1 LysR family transcriptional regulator [Hungatella sp. SL.1.14]MUB67126.1 LysR family transcriptional regulator [Hungatella hathewayi]CUQ59911.1 LysR family transcriptional regulator [Hungatella hathewayi]